MPHLSKYIRSLSAIISMTLISSAIICCGGSQKEGCNCAHKEKASETEDNSDSPSIKQRIDNAHEGFKEDVGSIGDVVDDKTRKVVKEGKRAVKKSAAAVEDTFDSSEEESNNEGAQPNAE